VKEIYVILGIVMFFMFLFWIPLCYRLFKILETRQPEKYEVMGKPSLIANNTLSNNITTVKFLLKREWREFDDSGLATLGKFMLVFWGIYMAAVLTGFSLFFLMALQQRP
jgi:hypothetical protein